MLQIPNDYDFIAEVYTQDKMWLDVYCRVKYDDDEAYYEILQVVGGLTNGGVVACPKRLDAYAEMMIDIEFGKYLEELKRESLLNWID